jgi:hypothetical protein
MASSFTQRRKLFAHTGFSHLNWHKRRRAFQARYAAKIIVCVIPLVYVLWQLFAPAAHHAVVTWTAV